MKEKKDFTLLISDGWMCQFGHLNDTEETAFEELSETLKFIKKRGLGSYSIVTLFDGKLDQYSPDILDRIISVYDDGIPCPERMKHFGFGSERGDVLEFLNDQVD